MGHCWQFYMATVRSKEKGTSFCCLGLLIEEANFLKDEMGITAKRVSRPIANSTSLGRCTSGHVRC